MSKFTFNLRDGEPQQEVEDLPNYRSARNAALHKVASVLAQEADQDRFSREGITMEVNDASGMILLRLDVSITEAAAVRGS